MTVQLFVYPTRSMARHIDPSLQILKELQVSEQIPNYMAYILCVVKQKVEIPIITVLRNKLSTLNVNKNITCWISLHVPILNSTLNQLTLPLK